MFWSQRHETVTIIFPTSTNDASVSVEEAGLTVLAGATRLHMELFAHVLPDECKWYTTDREVRIVLRKSTPGWWSNASKNMEKRFVHTDFDRWCEEDDEEYMGNSSFDTILCDDEEV